MRKCLAFLAAFLFLGAVPAFACTCINPRGTVEEQVIAARDSSSAVFTGKVVGYEYREGLLYDGPHTTRIPPLVADDHETMLVKFQVDQWWKMPQPNEVVFITDHYRLIKPPEEWLLLPRGVTIGGCGVGFVKDEGYLIYATGAADSLKYRTCSRTTRLSSAEDDLRVLGKGNKPRKSIN